MTISKEDRELIRKFDDIRQHGYYINSTHLQSVYNRVFDRNMQATNCGTCLRKRVQDLVNALNKLEAAEAKEAEKNKEREKEEETKDGSGGSAQKTKSGKKKQGDVQGKVRKGKGV